MWNGWKLAALVVADAADALREREDMAACA